MPPGEETTNSPVDDVQLDEPGWWPSCEAFLAHALRSEMTSKVWMEMYEDESKRVSTVKTIDPPLRQNS